MLLNGMKNENIVYTAFYKSGGTFLSKCKIPTLSISNSPISQISKLSLMSTNFIMDFLFGIGLQPLASSFEVKKC